MCSYGVLKKKLRRRKFRIANQISPHFARRREGNSQETEINGRLALLLQETKNTKIKGQPSYTPNAHVYLI